GRPAQPGAGQARAERRGTAGSRQVNGWRTMVQLVVQRARAAPLLVLLRLVGVLVAVALVCAISLYSSVMADALLQASLSPHGEDVPIAVASEPGSPTLLPYATLHALDRYLRTGAAGDLGLPLRTVTAHFTLGTSWPLTG